MKYYTEEEINNIISHVKKYTIHKQANNVRPALSLIFTLLGYFTSIVLCHYSAVGIIFVGCFSLRLFMIFHDCCHQAFYVRRTNIKYNINNMIARIVSPFVLLTHHDWVPSHNHHHRYIGNLNFEDTARPVYTLKHYNALSLLKKIAYRVFRSPLLFYIWIPLRFYAQALRYFSLFTSIIVLYFIVYTIFGARTFYFFVVGQYCSAMIGVMINSLLHSTNPGYLRHYDAASLISNRLAMLHSSGYLAVPFFLRWVTYGIEYHHIHHICSQVPCYLLKRCQDEGAELFHKNPRVGYWQAFRSLFHTLFDEEQGRYISSPLARWLGLQA